MAEVIAEFSAARRKRDTDYPWEEWEDGQIREARHGEDFTCKPGSFRQRLYSRAKDVGLFASVRMLDDGERIQFQFSESRPDER